jgi:acetate kinase
VVVLVVNTGSSSLKLRLLGDGDEILATHDLEHWDGRSGLDEQFDHRWRSAGAIGHRVVHGGADFSAATVLDDGVLARLEALTPLAPLHQPRSVAGIHAVRRALPGIAEVACFDTSFHATLAPHASTYALPAAWRKRWPLRRFGFHGLSHAYAARRAAEVLGRAPEAMRVVTCHLGAGASLCASLGGRSVDTTMGFTPLEGLVMATRSGSVDPGLVLWLQTEGGLSAEEVADGLELHSGLAGLSGTSGDLRDVGDDAAGRLAVAVYVHRLRKEIAAMAASLGGLDTLVFTGGVGEHQPAIRAAAAAGLGFLGVAVDGGRNATTTVDGEITAAGAAVATVVVTAREDLEIARQVRDTLRAAAGPAPADGGPAQ